MRRSGWETGSSADIGRRLDALPANRAMWSRVFLLSLGALFEIYDLFLTAYLSPGLVRAGIFRAEGTVLWLFSSQALFGAVTFAGLWVGTVAFSGVADRYGRRPIFAFSLLWYTIATLAMALQSTAAGIYAWRFVAGVGIGVELVTIDAYISEWVPKAVRGRAFAFNAFVQFLGVPLAALLAWALVPRRPLGIDGWRWVAFVSAAAALAVWLARRHVPESPRWLAVHGRRAEAEEIVAGLERAAGIQPTSGSDAADHFFADAEDTRSPSGDLLDSSWNPNRNPSSCVGRDASHDETMTRGEGPISNSHCHRAGQTGPTEQRGPSRHTEATGRASAPLTPDKSPAQTSGGGRRPHSDLRRRIAMLVVFQFFQSIGFYGFGNWLPTLLAANGAGVVRSLGYSFAIALAYPVAPLLCLTFADRFEPKRQIVAASLAIAGFGLVFAQQHSALGIVGFGLLVTFANCAMSYAFHAYQTELFPTAVRARAIGFCYSFSRLSTIFSSFMIAFFLHRFGTAGVFAFIAASMLVVATVIGTFGPRTRGKSLEDAALAATAQIKR